MCVSIIHTESAKLLLKIFSVEVKTTPLYVCVCTVYMVPAFHSSGQRICWSTSLRVTALSALITTGFTDIVTPLILCNCARGPCYFSSFSCYFFYLQLFRPQSTIIISRFFTFHCHPFVNVYLHVPQEIWPIILHHVALSHAPGISTIL